MSGAIVTIHTATGTHTISSLAEVDELLASGKITIQGAAEVRKALWQIGAPPLPHGYRWVAAQDERIKLGVEGAIYGLSNKAVAELQDRIRRQELHIRGVKIEPSPGSISFNQDGPIVVKRGSATRNGYGLPIQLIPKSFRAQLADEWTLRPNGKHVRVARWNGMEFVAIEIKERKNGSLIVDLRCPGREMTGLDVFPCGWSKKDRRYLSQLWALWSEHHQEVPGADWAAVTKPRLGETT